MRSRKPKPQEPTATATVAFHEAGHALASVLAFRAIGSGRRAIKYVEISEGEMPAGQWSGSCHGPDIYSPAWPVARIAPQNRRKMEWQIVIDLAGPIAEAVARGERRKKYAGTFALFYFGSSEDFSHAGKVIDDLCALTKRRQALRRFEQRALAVVLAHWPAVSMLAAALIEAGRLDGDQVEQIVTAGVRRRDNQATIRL
jgi:hypothetical protein